MVDYLSMHINNGKSVMDEFSLIKGHPSINIILAVNVFKE